MWATLDTWLIGDGQVPQLHVGEVLGDVGLRLNCESLSPSESPVPEARVLPAAETGAPYCRVRGTCLAEWNMSALLDIGGAPVLAEPEPRPRRLLATNGPSAEFTAPRAGEVVETTGWLEVVPDHEWDAFHHVDARRDWILHRVLLVRHRMVPGGAPRDAPTYGPVVDVTAQDRLLREPDTRLGSRYLIDLTVV